MNDLLVLVKNEHMKTVVFPLILIVAIALHLVSHFAFSEQYIFKQVVLPDNAKEKGQDYLVPVSQKEPLMNLSVKNQFEGELVENETIQNQDIKENDDFTSIVSFVSNE
jgi:hypothetical protein